MNITTSVTIIRDFISEKLHGDISRLPQLDIKLLKGDRRYGASPGCGFDPDNTIIARAIMDVAFSEVWPDCDYDAIMRMEYRGDTINTFNTMFGPSDGEGCFQGLRKFNPSEELIIRVRRFHSLYSTIGNIVLLPNKPVGKFTINTFRGTYSLWRDYFDRFLSAMRQYLVCGTSDSDMFSLLMEKNKKSILPYKGSGGFKELCERLYMEDYLTTDGKVRTLFPLVYWWNKKITRDSYLSAVENYLDFTERFILKRGRKIAGKLETLLEQH